MLSRLACLALLAFPLLTSAQAGDPVQDPVPDRDGDYPKLETTPIRPKQTPLEEPQFRIPEAQLERLRQESLKDPDLIIPLHIRDAKNHGGKR